MMLFLFLFLFRQEYVFNGGLNEPVNFYRYLMKISQVNTYAHICTYLWIIHTGSNFLHMILLESSSLRLPDLLCIPQIYSLQDTLVLLSCS
jgi:hypothetical protein